MKLNTNRWNRIRYTIIAPVYDLVAGFGGQRRRSIGLLELKPGESVLIVGAGTGADLPHIPAGVEVVAGDVTPAMVERIEKRAARLGRAVRVELMDGQALPLQSASFDAVILHLIVAVIPDPTACLLEAARVLKPEGRIVVFDKFVPDDKSPSVVRRVLNVVTATLFSDITRRLGPLLVGTGLEEVRREPAALAGQFQIALLRKRGGDSSS